ncbi:MAG: Alpha N-terminal protein methyltransferase 1 [Caeruleum heppii]|nr:MAG: Alpha N-terminal protein methyltransferase 1 [Caeruleum heppii]
MTTSPPDTHIDHAEALKYWSSISPDVNGMLGGFPQISRIDLQGSANFLAKIRRQSSSTTRPIERAVDCGAGIGRVTKGFLSKVAKVTDIVEPVEKFVDEIRHGESLAPLRKKGLIGEVHRIGLEDWLPQEKGYDLIWNQWCLGHLTDLQLVAYLQRCGLALRDGGFLVIKENMSTDSDEADIFDDVDNSVTRTDKKFRGLFAEGGLRIVQTELQSGFPRELGLFPVRFYALRAAPP